MKQKRTSPSIRLIAAGMVLAPIGTASVAMLVLGLSHLYIAQYRTAAIELVLCLIAGGVFLTFYGRYLDRLEQWAPSGSDQTGDAQPPVAATTSQESFSERTEATNTVAPSRSLGEPVSTDVVVAIVTLVYGMLIGVGGLIWTRGTALAFNLCAAVLFALCAGIVAWFGRRSRTG